MRGEVERVNSQCPADFDQLAEDYYFGTLAPAEAAALEEHFLGCPLCAERLELSDAWIAAVRSAARLLAGERPLSAGS